MLNTTKIMKLRYILAALAASMFLMVGCNEDEELGTLGSIQVSDTYVSLPMSGGTKTVTVNATDSWTISSDIPEWLTVSPTSGSAGQTSITISAPETISGKGETEIAISCGGYTQYINVIQGLKAAEDATCAKVNAGPEGKTYRVTGTVTAIANTEYGNFYIKDDTGDLYIYGVKNASGQYPKDASGGWASFGIDVADVVTIEGPKKLYNGTVEIVDAAVVKVVKSLIKLEEGAVNGFDAAGGDFIVKLVCKGNGPTISIPEDAKDWVSVTGVSLVKDTTVISFHVAESQQEAARTAEISFTSASGKSSSTVTSVVSQTGLQGTLTNPFTIAQAIEYCKTLSGESASEFYVKGKVSAVLYTFNASKGVGTFWLSDDGVAHGVTGDKKSTTDPDHDFECYSVYFFGNQPWVDGNAQIEVGDEVIVHGKLTVYNGIYETSSKKAYIHSINGVTTDANGVGNANKPFNVAGAAACIEAGCQNDVCVKGKVSAILYTFSASYGYGTFWISDDGKAYGVTENKKSTTDPEHDFECYSVYWLGNKPWVEGDGQVAIGDDVIVRGLLTKYGSIYETSSKKAYVYSLNGKTE